MACCHATRQRLSDTWQSLAPERGFLPWSMQGRTTPTLPMLGDVPDLESPSPRSASTSDNGAASKFPHAEQQQVNHAPSCFTGRSCRTCSSFTTTGAHAGGLVGCHAGPGHAHAACSERAFEQQQHKLPQLFSHRSTPLPAFPGTCLTGQGASSSPFIAPSVAHAQSSSRCCHGGNATACSTCHHQRTFGRREVAALKFQVAAAGTGAETAPM